MANYWMHNGFLQVEGEKMSKSLGNFVTIHELLHTEKFGGRKWPGEVLRLAMLRTHYRQPIDWTVKALEEAEKNWRDWISLAHGLNGFDARDLNLLPQRPLYPKIEVALFEDLNTPLALSELSQLRNAVAHSPNHSNVTAFTDALRFFGLYRDDYSLVDELSPEQKQRTRELIDLRLAARAAKNWAESDRIRDELAEMGIALKDNKDGTTTWEAKR
jgi:cysteinyl-tRNA synthetase